MSETANQRLPVNWAATTIGEIAETIRGVTYKKENASDKPAKGLLPILRATNIDRELDFEELVYVPSQNVSDSQLLHTNDIVLAASSGSRNIVGKAAILSREWTGSFGAFCYCLRANPAVNAKLLAYFLQTSEYRNQVSELSAGVNINNLRRHHIEGLSYRLPPINEQNRIVEEIEKQLTRLDAAVAALKRVQANLKRYRAAVLKAACEGRLVPTEAELARREGRSYEPASVLLERISSEPYAAHVPAEELPVLPEGWTWISLGSILRSIEAGKSFKCEERPPGPLQIGVVKVSAVTWGEFDEQESKTCRESQLKESYLIREGDFLFSRANTIELVGACVIVKSVSSRLMLSDKILRFNLTALPKEWVLYCLRAEFGRAEIERLSTGNQESMRNIGQTRIRSIRIPLPPLAEIERILADLASRLSIMNEIDVEVASDLGRADRLRQSILKRAFEGKLVPQDSNDEPAKDLLERIRGTANPGCGPTTETGSKSGRRAATPKEIVNA